ncbi:uncharacterized protein A1O9_01093 [Exophiala aquamarina CBS 119918]|uniref:Glutamine amidotransferase domain-containing protein n=1 Tax=Exophiala aquamarina CBS 119918 TaxID=1182545 RepID=A0A072PTP0_9EURO|nr:uncharacterized protein A1O9_01093 [Exophiala aquamarina CBS 119918]KEF63117.1 hypothetical protein A1O9_01093 [Exophiala aquamarina CBS 119918]
MKNDVVRMLILETDEPHPNTMATKGSFGEILDNLFTEAGIKHDPPLGIETDMHYVVEDGTENAGHVPTIEEIPGDTTAVLVTGSMYDAHGNDEWILKLVKLLQDLWQQRPQMRFSGVCFGHQLLCRMLGGKVGPHPENDWELAHTKIELTEIGRRLFCVEEPSIHLHQMHQDHVSDAPSAKYTDLLGLRDDVHIWGRTDHTFVQGVYLRDKLFTTQGHLGFDEKMVHRQVDMRKANGGIKDSDFAEERKKTAVLEHDGIVVASAILRFFHGEDHEIY